MVKKLVELHEGKRTELFRGTLEQIVEYLKDNKDVYSWQLDKDKNAEQPNLEDIFDWMDLKRELDKISLGWWDLVLEEMDLGRELEKINLGWWDLVLEDAKDFDGMKWGGLTEEEREYLTSEVHAVDGRTGSEPKESGECIIDLVYPYSVPGYYKIDEEETYFVIDDNAIIYAPSR